MSDRQLQYAGEYRLDSLKIFNRDEEMVDLSGVVLEIDFHEDIDLLGITGTILCSTTKNVINDLPIIGEEKLELVIQTPSTQGFDFFKKEWKMGPIKTDDGSTAVVDKRFHVYSVDTRVHSENFSQATFVLKFCSQEISDNVKKSVNRSIKGTSEDLVNLIFRKDLKSVKDIKISTSEGIQNIVVPNLTPIETIKFISTITEDQESDPSYYFYENHHGYNFRTLRDMFNEEPVWKLGMASEGKNADNLFSQLQSLTGHNMSHNDKLLDTKSGVLGSRLLVHDIFNKRYLIKDYDYVNEFYVEKHLEDEEKSVQPIYTSDLDYKESRTLYQTTSIKQKNDKQFNGLFYGTHDLPNELSRNQSSRRLSHKEQMKQSFGLECQWMGNTNLTCGDLIEVNIPKAVDSSHGEYGKDDRFFSGNFLVNRVRHRFTTDGMEHRAYLHLTKDSQVDEFDFDDLGI